MQVIIVVIMMILVMIMMFVFIIFNECDMNSWKCLNLHL